jgi:hypothetical protein
MGRHKDRTQRGKNGLIGFPVYIKAIYSNAAQHDGDENIEGEIKFFLFASVDCVHVLIVLYLLEFDIGRKDNVLLYLLRG